MPTARAGACLALYENKIYVLGGRDALGQVVDVVERYDPVNDTWETSLPELRDERENGAAAVFEGQLIVIGGRDDEGEILDKVEVFDADRNEWRSFDNLQYRREGAGAVVLDGQLFAVGGFGFADDDNGQPAFLNNVEVYTSEEDKWQPFPSWQPGSARASFAAIAAEDSVFVFGGFNNFGPSATTERYAPGFAIAPRANMLAARGALAFAGGENRLFAFGGRLRDDSVSGSVEVFSPAQNHWQSAAALRRAREQAGAVFVNDRLYVIGGRDGDGNVLASVESATAGDILTSVRGGGGALPEDFYLRQNYPNPFNPATALEFAVQQRGGVRLEVYNLRGERIAVLFDGGARAGTHRVHWDGRDGLGVPVPSGIYFAKLSQGPLRQVVKMVLQR